MAELSRTAVWTLGGSHALFENALKCTGAKLPRQQQEVSWAVAPSRGILKIQEKYL
jgi:hypothetical protein